MILVLSSTFCISQQLKQFPLSTVSVGAGPFLDAQNTDLKYILALKPNRLLAPFLREAGLPVTEPSYGNWENTGLDGHIGGHYLSALALMSASSGNDEVTQRLDYMISQLAKCQKQNGNGYVGAIPDGQKMWNEIAQGKINAHNFSLNDRWVPLYNIHKLFAGLRDAYIVAGNKEALEVLIKLTDWFLGITSTLSNEQIQTMLKSEHGGLNEVFADVYSITGDQKYLDLAKRFSHQAILNPLLDRRDELTGLHANTQIPKVIGYKRIADLSSDKSWSDAADFFWETVVAHRSVSIGGNSVREHFHPANDFSPMIESNQGPETCNSYNMLRLTKLLFLSDQQGKYMDFYERTLYNHILSSQHPSGGFVYFTPMRPRHYRVYSDVDASFWCCVGSGIENHAKFGELIYAHSDKDLYVNLFIASRLNWKERGIKIEQDTKFPFEERTSLKVVLDKPQQFKLALRKPGWVRATEMKIHVNGNSFPLTDNTSSYIIIDRKWKNGDVVTAELPMHVELEFLPDKSSWASFLYGPVVLAAATDSTDLTGLRADGSRMGHVAEGKFYPLSNAPLIVKKRDAPETELVKDTGTSISFSAKTLIYPEKFNNLKLIPFFQLHDSRYMIYWKITTPENLDVIKEQIRESEAKQLAIQQNTIDWITLGEQQPETEHNFRGDAVESGSTDGMRWRGGKGWFSYTLNNKDNLGKALSITMASNERNRKFDVLIGEKVVRTITPDLLANGSETTNLEISLPQGSSAEKMTITFRAYEGFTTGRIYEIRLLKSSAGAQ